MKLSVGRCLVESLVAVVLAVPFTPCARATDASAAQEPRIASLLQEMEGSWTVSERMWPGSGQMAVELPAAMAHRRLIQKSFLEEVMEPVHADAKEAFNRTSYFEFNATSHKFEYFSIDSRLPQMMNERSVPMSALPSDGWIKLDGSHFVAPRWGEAKNVPFRYRLTVGPVRGDRQVVQLFLTPESGKDRKEFLAFEYVYVRAP